MKCIEDFCPEARYPHVLSCQEHTEVTFACASAETTHCAESSCSTDHQCYPNQRLLPNRTNVEFGCAPAELLGWRSFDYTSLNCIPTGDATQIVSAVVEALPSKARSLRHLQGACVTKHRMMRVLRRSAHQWSSCGVFFQ